MPDDYTVILGTRNKKKGVELALLIAPPWEPNPRLGRLKVRTLDDCDSTIDVVEDAETFAGNARKKASETAVALGRWVLADDLGPLRRCPQGCPRRLLGALRGDSRRRRGEQPQAPGGTSPACPTTGVGVASRLRALALADPSGANSS